MSSAQPDVTGIDPANPSPKPGVQPLSVTIVRAHSPAALYQGISVLGQAFAQPFITLLFNSPAADREHAELEAKEAKAFPSVACYVAIDSTDPDRPRPVGYAKWNFVASPSDHDASEPCPAGCDIAVRDEFIGGIESRRKARWPDGGVAYLWILAITPDVQRRGVGARLIKEGLKEAKKRGLRWGWVEASPEGLGLYQRWGFKEEFVHTRYVDKLGDVFNSYLSRDADKWDKLLEEKEGEAVEEEGNCEVLDRLLALDQK